MTLSNSFSPLPSNRRSRRVRRRSGRHQRPLGPNPTAPPSPLPSLYQNFDCTAGSRLVDKHNPLFAVVLSVLSSRMYYGDLFAKNATSSTGLELRLMAHFMPVPTIHQMDKGFCDAVFHGVRKFAPTVFDGESVASIRPYLEHLISSGIGKEDDQGSKSVLLLMLIYLDRVYASCPALMLTSANVIKLMAAAYILAFKVLEDVNWGVAGLVSVVCIDCKELCSIESALLKLLDYRLNVSPEQFREAEIKFAAEALDWESGSEVLNELYEGCVEGISESLDMAKNWVEFVPLRGSKSSLQETTGIATATFFLSGNRSWRSRLVSDPLPYDWEWEIRRRQQELAGAVYTIDFGHLPLTMGMEEAEWQVAGYCEQPGLDRFRCLRRLLISEDYSVSIIPPLVMRARPFSWQLWPQQSIHGNGLNLALGRRGRSLEREGWDAALAVPNATEEYVEDAHLPELPLPSPRYSRFHSDWDAKHAPDVGYYYVQGFRMDRSGSPCTPVGARGGIVSTRPPFFDDPSLLYGERKRPSHASRHGPPQPPLLPSHPPGFDPLPSRSAVSEHNLFPSLPFLSEQDAAFSFNPPTLNGHSSNHILLPQSHGMDPTPSGSAEDELVHVGRRRQHFEVVGSSSLFTNQEFLYGGAGSSLFSNQEFLSRTQRQSQPGGSKWERPSGSPTHITSNVAVGSLHGAQRNRARTHVVGRED